MKPRSGSTRSSGSSSTAGPSAWLNCSMRSNRTRGTRACSCRSRRTRPTSTPSRRRIRSPSPATGRSSAASRASSAGTRWPWWCAPTGTPTASAATSRPSPRRPRCTRSASTTSSAGRIIADGGDLVYFQGHASPGIYARAFLEGRLSAAAPGEFPPRTGRRAAGCRRYPHPWLMPNFWQFPTVSMGLGPIMAIYQARFIRYLEDRGLKKPTGQQGLGVPRRRRDRRARDARRDHARVAREARQPDLRHQLQPPAAGRPGARQRQDHPGTRRRVPRRRLERHQGHLGHRVGRPARARQVGPARPAHGRGGGRRVPDVLGVRRRLHPPALLRHVPAAARPGEAPLRRPAEEAAARRPRPGEGLRGLQGGDRDDRGRPR